MEVSDGRDAAEADATEDDNVWRGTVSLAADADKPSPALPNSE